MHRADSKGKRLQAGGQTACAPRLAPAPCFEICQSHTLARFCFQAPTCCNHCTQQQPPDWLLVGPAVRREPSASSASSRTTMTSLKSGRPEMSCAQHRARSSRNFCTKHGVMIRVTVLTSQLPRRQADTIANTALVQTGLSRHDDSNHHYAAPSAHRMCRFDSP